jgi:hypothetical protein
LKGSREVRDDAEAVNGKGKIEELLVLDFCIMKIDRKRLIPQIICNRISLNVSSKPPHHIHLFPPPKIPITPNPNPLTFPTIPIPFPPPPASPLLPITPTHHPSLS